jgi:hypothetical protein
MRVACLFHENEALFQRAGESNAFNKGWEALWRLLKKESWTMLERLVPLQKGF